MNKTGNALLLTLVLAFFADLAAADQPSLDRKNMDFAINPGDDFYRFANGNWINNLALPEDKSEYDSFTQVREQNRARLRDLIEGLAAKAAQATPGSAGQKVGDFYAAAMDTAKIEALGATPLQADFARIAGVSNLEQLQDLMADFQKDGVNAMFGPGVEVDMANSKAYAFYLGQGGLGMPDRDYYIKDDPDSQKIRAEYARHIAAMLGLLGDSPEAAAAAARTVMNIETRLAKASKTRLELRDVPNLYNKMPLAKLQEHAPGVDWSRFLNNLGSKEIPDLVVMSPNFFKELGLALTDVPLADWKTYLRWQLLTAAAPYLSSPFVNENFRFFGTVMEGTPALEERWKRMTSLTSASLGELVGQMYVEKYFPPEYKKRMNELATNVKRAFESRLQKLPWMGDATRQAAMEKVRAMRVEVGYPDKWEDYSRLSIGRDSLILNLQRVNRFLFQKNYDQLGKPVDTLKWEMPPQAVNAYHHPLYNKMVFPAGILQPPFFSAEADDAVNYGAIGMGIGHEMSHGFDDNGRNFDKDGNMRDWWTKEDAEKFKAQTKLLVEQYNGFATADGVHVNGELCLGEDIADYAGLTVALAAYHLSLEGKARPQPIDGFTDDQRFFLSFAQLWRGKIRPEALKRKIQEDVHPWGEFRVNGAPFNVPEFYTAFNIQPKNKLYRAPEQRPVIW